MSSHPVPRKPRVCRDSSGKVVPCPKTKKGVPPLDTDELSSPAVEATFEIRAEVLKGQSFDQGLVLGWAMVCLEKGEQYFDLQDEHITEKAMLEAATDFAQNSGVAKEMHTGGPAGTVVHTFPLTTDIAKAFGLETDRTGLMIAMKPDALMLDKFKREELTGFSIGGFCNQIEEVD